MEVVLKAFAQWDTERFRQQASRHVLRVAFWQEIPKATHLRGRDRLGIIKPPPLRIR